jgi:Spy/CpxP family protein refolding chaperone
MKHLLLAAVVAAVAVPLAALAASPYVDQTSRSIKALSDGEVADYLAGRGMGLAKAAELNGYPGPAHVLELSEQLALSPAQRQQTEAIFGRMQDEAKRLGRRLVDEERELDQLFASKAISPSLLHDKLDSIASLQSEVREVHLRAHLEEAGVLSAEQAASYWHLRGYAHGDMEHKHVH